MKTKKPSAPSPPPAKQARASKNTAVTFPIVGIGASAGGLEAFEEFFRHAPTASGMAFVLVSHLDPGHASMLTEILQRTTTMPLIEALDQIQVEPNCVYVIPPNRDMAIFHGALHLTIPDQPRGRRMPIDAFLRALAEDQQENAIGIILSGTGSDGTLGLRAILGAGGVTLVQEPATAKYDGMPLSAIQAGYATHVVPVNKMPEILLSRARSFVIHTETPAAPTAASGLSKILMQLRSISGHDFSQYKKSTIGRRIERRMSQHNIKDIDVYARYLKENPPEAHKLFKELLINVTNFFRDPEAFDVLKKDILPLLFHDKPGDYAFRVWVAGCATGEEAYSIAILLHELMEEKHLTFKFQIYSTDLDEDAIAIARAGTYPLNIAQDVTPERLQRFFSKEDTGYRIKKEIREMVVFAIQNVIKDAPFTKLDLLSCRNLMIYLEPELQNRLIAAFHYALKPGGVLFLSPSESIGDHTELFSWLNRKWKFYSATHSAASTDAMMSTPMIWTAARGGEAPKEIMTKTRETNYAALTHRVLVQYFAPASVVSDIKGDILYVHGETGKYLRPAPGQASLNVIEMAREGLELELRAAIQTAGSEGKPTLNREIQVKSNGGFSMISLSVRPLSGPDGAHNLLLVSFQDIASPAAKPGRKRVANPVEQVRIKELERDLELMKESHQFTVQEQQASNEELKSTNEEMQSTNEELQSTNEELETSKEELQSVNEELISVNSELQAKIGQLIDLQNDMKNLLDNINTGIIILDRYLKIRSFTREATRIFRLVPSDAGRPLNDIKSDIAGDDLTIAVQAVLDSLIPYEREMHINDQLWMLVRIQPYRTLDNLIDGVVLTFTDISIKAVAAQELLKLAENITATAHEPLIVLDNTLKVIAASPEFYREFQAGADVSVGRRIYELGNHQWDIPALRELLENILPDGRIIENYPVEHNFPIIGQRKMLLNARPFTGNNGLSQLILLSIKVNA
ncbi:MAG: chemotaxis protein CheB [Gammaproteobacteria bacterium]